MPRRRRQVASLRLGCMSPALMMVSRGWPSSRQLSGHRPTMASGQRFEACCRAFEKSVNRYAFHDRAQNPRSQKTATPVDSIEPFHTIEAGRTNPTRMVKANADCLAKHCHGPNRTCAVVCPPMQARKSARKWANRPFPLKSDPAKTCVAAATIFHGPNPAWSVRPSGGGRSSGYGSCGHCPETCLTQQAWARYPRNLRRASRQARLADRDRFSYRTAPAATPTGAMRLARRRPRPVFHVRLPGASANRAGSPPVCRKITGPRPAKWPDAARAERPA